jgi:murein DD-endopeptidase MepM/ murein hydrolase activator NlpD
MFIEEIYRFVDKGDLIGLVGNTGRSTNPHLHFQKLYNDNAIDPAILMNIPNFRN